MTVITEATFEEGQFDDVEGRLFIRSDHSYRMSHMQERLMILTFYVSSLARG